MDLVLILIWLAIALCLAPVIWLATGLWVCSKLKDPADLH